MRHFDLGLSELEWQGDHHAWVMEAAASGHFAIYGTHPIIKFCRQKGPTCLSRVTFLSVRPLYFWPHYPVITIEGHNM